MKVPYPVATATCREAIAFVGAGEEDTTLGAAGGTKDEVAIKKLGEDGFAQVVSNNKAINKNNRYAFDTSTCLLGGERVILNGTVSQASSLERARAVGVAIDYEVGSSYIVAR